MVRLSSQSKSSPVSAVAEYKPTGMCTRPKDIAPFQIVRVDVGAIPPLLEAMRWIRVWVWILIFPSVGGRGVGQQRQCLSPTVYFGHRTLFFALLVGHSTSMARFGQRHQGGNLMHTVNPKPAHPVPKQPVEPDIPGKPPAPADQPPFKMAPEPGQPPEVPPPVPPMEIPPLVPPPAPETPVGDPPVSTPPIADPRPGM